MWSCVLVVCYEEGYLLWCPRSSVVCQCEERGGRGGSVLGVLGGPQTQLGIWGQGSPGHYGDKTCRESLCKQMLTELLLSSSIILMC